MKESKREAEKRMINEVFERFINSYSGRDINAEFPGWLTERLQQEIPEMSADACEKLSREIMEAVASYDQQFSELNKAVEAGQSKVEWLAEKLSESYAGMQPSEAGRKLSQIEHDMLIGSHELMPDIEIIPAGALPVFNTETVGWNQYSLKQKAYDIGQQAAASGLSVAAAIIKENLENSEETNVNDLIGQALQTSIQTASGEIKAVVAGAIKTAAKKGLTGLLPIDTPVSSVGTMACVAVESADAMLGVAKGNKTMTQALDQTGRACVAAISSAGSDCLKAKVAFIPVIGPIIAWLGDGLFKHMKSPKFTENVYTVVRDAAKATWDGAKQKVKGLFSKIKSSVTEIFNI